MKVKVQNLCSKKSGREVPNQFVISVTDDKGNDSEVFQSYRTVIAVKHYGKRPARFVLDTGALDYSKTTSRYLYEFLGEDRKTIQSKINSGEYQTADLNAK